MLKQQKVLVKWHPNNIKHYVEKGYVYTKTGQVFEAWVEDVVPTSKIDVIAVCDICGKEYVVSMCNYTRSMKNSGSVVCKECKSQKTKATLLRKYGVDIPSKINDFADKQKQTCLVKYGVENPMQLPEAKEKAKQTLIKHYGVDTPYKNEELRQRAINSCLQKYGVSNSFASKEIREKIKQTMLTKYGAENPRTC